MEGVDEEIVFEIWFETKNGEWSLEYELETLQEAVEALPWNSAFYKIVKRRTTVTRKIVKF